MKRLDELDQKKQADADFTGESCTSKFAGHWIPPEYRDKDGADNYAVEKRALRWSEFKRMQAEEMLQHVQGKVFPFLKGINGAESNFTHHMQKKPCSSSPNLALQIESRLHERQGKVLNIFALTLPPSDSDMAAQVFKDPYLFDFLGTANTRKEREVEQALIDHVQKFLLELGAGFAFVGRQVLLEVGDPAV